jgi:hypothetical protein
MKRREKKRIAIGLNEEEKSLRAFSTAAAVFLLTCSPCEYFIRCFDDRFRQAN